MAEEAAPEYEMTTFQLVFVVRNPEYRDDPRVSEEFAAHRVERIRTASSLFLRNLINDDVALIAGPILDDERIEQVAVFDMETRDEVEKLLQRNPSVETGRYELEIYTWWAAKDILQKPKRPETTWVAYLGLLKRPAKAPHYPAEKLEELQRGHLENIGKMAESGDLVIAGPLEDGDDLRGILIFRTRDAERIQELVARDPAIQAGRLELELYRWRVPRRSFPSLPKD